MPDLKGEVEEEVDLADLASKLSKEEAEEYERFFAQASMDDLREMADILGVTYQVRNRLGKCPGRSSLGLTASFQGQLQRDRADRVPGPGAQRVGRGGGDQEGGGSRSGAQECKLQQHTGTLRT